MAASSGELPHAEIKSARYYAAPDLALRDIQLSIVPGVFVVVTGPAASGKSTLCYCLTGVIPRHTQEVDPLAAGDDALSSPSPASSE